MRYFTAFDGTDLAYRRSGTGEPLVCVPGGPLLPAEYLGDLGGLSHEEALILLDHRGSGASGIPSNSQTYRCDRVVQDVEALRLHLGIERLALLGHSAGAGVVLRYAERHPDRVSRLVLITPSTQSVGIDITDEARSRVAQSRADEAWYRTAAAALARIQAGSGTAEDWAAIIPFTYGQWDTATAAYDAHMKSQRNLEGIRAFSADGAFDPPATRAALAALDVPVQVVAGGLDVNSPPVAVAELTGLFRRGDLLVQEGAGHYPWLDDPVRFRELLRSTTRPG